MVFRITLSFEYEMDKCTDEWWSAMQHAAYQNRNASLDARFARGVANDRSNLFGLGTRLRGRVNGSRAGESF